MPWRQTLPHPRGLLVNLSSPFPLHHLHCYHHQLIKVSRPQGRGGILRCSKAPRSTIFGSKTDKYCQRRKFFWVVCTVTIFYAACELLKEEELQSIEMCHLYVVRWCLSYIVVFVFLPSVIGRNPSRYELASFLGKPSKKNSHVSMDTFRTPLSPPPRVYGRLGGSFF